MGWKGGEVWAINGPDPFSHNYDDGMEARFLNREIDREGMRMNVVIRIDEDYGTVGREIFVSERWDLGMRD